MKELVTSGVKFRKEAKIQLARFCHGQPEREITSRRPGVKNTGNQSQEGSTHAINDIIFTFFFDQPGNRDNT